MEAFEEAAFAGPGSRALGFAALGAPLFLVAIELELRALLVGRFAFGSASGIVERVDVRVFLLSVTGAFVVIVPSVNFEPVVFALLPLAVLLPNPLFFETEFALAFFPVPETTSPPVDEALFLGVLEETMTGTPWRGCFSEVERGDLEDFLVLTALGNSVAGLGVGVSGSGLLTANLLGAFITCASRSLTFEEFPRLGSIETLPIRDVRHWSYGSDGGRYSCSIYNFL